jgi:hypothetical protein
MTSANLHEGFNKLVDTTIKIEHVYYSRNPLLWWQVDDRIFHHAYIVFRTADGYWWSNEKNSKGIIMQRSMKEENIRDIFEKKVRITAEITVLNIELLYDDPAAPDTISNI